MDTRNLASLAGVLLVIGAAGWYWGMGNPKSSGIAADDRQRPDYVVTDIAGLETNEKGQVTRRLTAPEVRHYDKPRDEAEMDKPVFTLYDEGREAWRVTAEHGHSLDMNTEVLLQDKVHAERRDPAAVAVTLDTDTLHVFPKEERLYSKSVVQVHSPQGKLSSKGIEANIRTGDLVLNENVTGNYAPAPR